MPLCVQFVDANKDIREEFIIATRVCGDKGMMEPRYSSWCTGTHKGEVSTGNLYTLQWTLLKLGDQPFMLPTFN